MLQFRGSLITSDAGLLSYRELDDTLGRTDTGGDMLADARTGRNGRHRLVGLLRQSVFGRLAGYEDVNDADRLCHDPAMSRRLATIPGIGPITASAIAAAAPDASLFRSGRQFAALGLTPRTHSSGGKERLVGISKQGDGYIRCHLVIGATAGIRFARQGNAQKAWAAKLLERKSARLVSVALANKTARTAWAVLARNQSYVAPAM
jgi:transposase